MSVGVRELKNSLSKYLAEARKGKTVTVTDHGKPIARIVPIGDTTFERLVAEGKITPGRRPKRPAPQPIKINGTVSDLIDDQRR